LNKYKTIDDIIVFGSIVKGSSEPKDLDVGLMLKDESDIRNIKESIRLISKEADIEIIDSIYNPLWVVLMREGFSVKKNKFLFELYKIEPMVLYKYSLKKLTPVQKVQFTRGFKEVLKNMRAKVLSRSIVLVPIDRKAEFDDFLNTWSLTYETQNYELFPILRKGELI
jgi:predicted nucleotidyltransferase